MMSEIEKQKETNPITPNDFGDLKAQSCDEENTELAEFFIILSEIKDTEKSRNYKLKID